MRRATYEWLKLLYERFGPREFGKLSLQLCHLRSHDPLTAFDGFGNGARQVRTQAAALRLQIDEGNHEGAPAVCRAF